MFRVADGHLAPGERPAARGPGGPGRGRDGDGGAGLAQRAHDQLLARERGRQQCVALFDGAVRRHREDAEGERGQERRGDADAPSLGEYRRDLLGAEAGAAEALRGGQAQQVRPCEVGPGGAPGTVVPGAARAFHRVRQHVGGEAGDGHLVLVRTEVHAHS
ncbi:hypothetical protein MTP03_43420 [Tsukamurella sp. PLM1]|nr:hypothetical protein MTP03_43420 [Tsukamurella sp. PLM1]